MRDKLGKLIEIVSDIFVLFVFMVYGSIAINTALDNPRYGLGILVFTVGGYTVYRLAITNKEKRLK